MSDAILARGIDEWNRGEHYEAHETLEDFADAIEDDDTDHRITLALVRVAACLHKLLNDVGPEAVPGKLRHARGDLDDAPAQWRGIDLATLKRELEAFQQVIDRGERPKTWPRVHRV